MEELKVYSRTEERMIIEKKLTHLKSKEKRHTSERRVLIKNKMIRIANYAEIIQMMAIKYRN